MSKAGTFVPPDIQKRLDPKKAKWLFPELILTIIALMCLLATWVLVEMNWPFAESVKLTP